MTLGEPAGAGTAVPADDAPGPARPRPRRAPIAPIRLVALTGGAGLAVVAAIVAATGWVANESRSRGIDAMTMLETGLRLKHFGGSYYTTGADHKGPLFQAVYDLAARLGGRAYGWWYVSLLVAFVGAWTAWSVARIVRSIGAPVALAAGIAVAVFCYLTLARTGFSGILYARNLTTALVVFVMAEVLTARHPRPPWRWAVTGLAGGIAAQTILTELGSVLVAGAGLWWVARSWRSVNGERPAGRVGRVVAAVPPEVLRYAGGVVVGIGAPFVWYSGRGLLSEYVYWWWTYSGYYADSPGRSNGEIVRAGLQTFRHYYATEPWQLLTLVLFFVLLATTALRPSPARPRHLFAGLVVTGWWLASCGSVAAAQRYSLHHYLVSVTPVIVMAAILVHALVSPALSGTLSLGAPVGAVRDTDHDPTDDPVHGAAGWLAALALATAVVVATGTTEFRSGWRNLAHFGGFRHRAETIRRNVGAEIHTIRAITAFFTPPADGAWAWSTQPYWVGYFDRVAGSRYIESRILNGYIYLGGQRDLYVPRNAWGLWAADLEQSRTAVVADTDDYRLAESFPGRRYLDTTFIPAAEVDRWNLWVRRSRLAALAPRGGGREVTFAPGSTVRVSSGRRCVEVRPAGPVSVRVQAVGSASETAAIDLSTDTVRAMFGPEGASQELHQAPRPPGASPRVLVGRRALVVLDGNRVVSAIVRPAGADEVVLTPGSAAAPSRASVVGVAGCWGFA